MNGTTSRTIVHVDTHVHTRASFDAVTPIRTVLERAEAAGLDGVAVTDHDTVVGARRAVEFASEYDVFVLPGVEVSTADGHLLALGVHEDVPAGASLADTVATVRDRGGVAVVPHPFQVSRHGVRKRTLLGVDVAPDGVETYNAHLMTGIRNRRAREFAGRHSYPRFGGSDAHTPGTVGQAYTAVSLPADVSDLSVDVVLDAMRAGRTAARGRRAPMRSYVDKLADSARRKTDAAVPWRRVDRSGPGSGPGPGSGDGVRGSR